MPSYVIPEAIEIREIAQDFEAQLMLNDPIFDLFPMDTTNDQNIAWDQEDNYFGLQQLRGMDGAPNRVKNVGVKTYVYTPPVFGEHIDFKESEILRQRRYGTLADSINLEALAVRKSKQLVARRIRRMRHMLWTMVSTGTFSLRLPTGGVGFSDSYTVQTFAASAWGTPATGTPLADFRSLKALAKGHSVSFGRQALAFMNINTATKMMKNSNAADLSGKRGIVGSTINSITGLNEILLDNDLPQIVVVEQSYFDDNNVAQWFLADNITVVVGHRDDGEPVGHFITTPNINNPNMEAGPYHKLTNEPDRVPPVIATHDGFTGGPTVEFPSAVVVMTNT